jgi:hypothetical protein
MAFSGFAMPPDQKAFQTWSTCDLTVASMVVPSLRAPRGASGILSDLTLAAGHKRADKSVLYSSSTCEMLVAPQGLPEGRT